ncbi:MAG: siroheme synthase [Syntrophobacterales bacterium CG_4_8_14_3_um_filter_49_14]|nr:MAG: siroheme synthase [Syntrophobacterales bacterium CG23_combo_of_CG06-09_8_20_14_all_48_27]PJC72791.1 MAG: siroheme synthase [Syntrophobacterales bacterium CG_4_8_14_3_um_filter_49_14]
MKYYPLCLQVTDKKCVVVGGGEVAERKVKRLVECGACVTVVGKMLTPFLRAMTAEGRIAHIAADYDEAYIHGALLVIGATDRDEVNERICREAREKNILVNIVDDPARCDFILPSLLQRGDLLLAISTGGKSPALARKLREELERHYGPEYATLLELLGELREKMVVRSRSSPENKRVFTALVNSDILQYIREKNWSCVKKVIHDIMNINIDITHSS